MHERISSDPLPKRRKPLPDSDPTGFKQFAYKGGTLSRKQMGCDVIVCWFILIILPNMSLISMELSVR